jgi:hypothetical protein
MMSLTLKLAWLGLGKQGIRPSAKTWSHCVSPDNCYRPHPIFVDRHSCVLRVGFDRMAGQPGEHQNVLIRQRLPVPAIEHLHRDGLFLLAACFQQVPAEELSVTPQLPFGGDVSP